jgi:hypothetical protein
MTSSVRFGCAKVEVEQESMAVSSVGKVCDQPVDSLVRWQGGESLRVQGSCMD